MVYALTTVSPPFSGSVEEIRNHHLHTVPPSIEGVPRRISVIVTHMLPCFGNRLGQDLHLSVAQGFSLTCRWLKCRIGFTFSNLDAAKQVANREALEEANKEAAATLRNERNSIFEVSEHELFSIKERLFNEIKDISESVEINYNGALVFGNAGLVFGEQTDTFQQVDTIL